MLVFDFAPPQEQAVTIDMGKHGSFDLLIRPPTFGDEMAALFAESPPSVRLTTAVTGWQGVKDAAGADVPFSLDALAAVSRRFGLAAQIANAVMQFYGGPTENDSKNSESPRKHGSEPTNAATPKE